MPAVPLPSRVPLGGQVTFSNPQKAWPFTDFHLCIWPGLSTNICEPIKRESRCILGNHLKLWVTLNLECSCKRLYWREVRGKQLQIMDYCGALICLPSNLLVSNLVFKSLASSIAKDMVPSSGKPAWCGRRRSTFVKLAACSEPEQYVQAVWRDLPEWTGWGGMDGAGLVPPVRPELMLLLLQAERKEVTHPYVGRLRSNRNCILSLNLFCI